MCEDVPRKRVFMGALCEVEFLGGVVFNEGAAEFLMWYRKAHISLLPDRCPRE